MRIFDEFREFAVKGNAMDLAVGIVIGAAFQKIVNSLVNDLIMPPISALMGRVKFSDYYINLSGQEFASFAEAKAAGVPTVNYGLFLQNILEFLIIAWALFLIVKVMNRLRREQEKVAAKEQKQIMKEAVKEAKK